MPLPWPPIGFSVIVEAIETVVLLLGCWKVECLPLQSNSKWKSVDYLLEVVGIVQLIDVTNFLQRFDAA